MIKKQVNIDGKEYTLGMSALLPKVYRARHGRDFVQDMTRLSSSFQGKDEGGRDDILESIVWETLLHGGSEVGENMDEWLMNIDSPFAMYELLPAVLELWTANNKMTSVPRKK